MAISRPARGSTARAACSSVNGGGKVGHVGGLIVGLRSRSALPLLSNSKTNHGRAQFL